MSARLSKLSYLRGLQCHKSLYLARFHELWEHLKLDTLGMVRILETLESISRRSHEPNNAA